MESIDPVIETQTLVRKALGGDLESYGMLCSHYYSSMVALAYSVLFDHHLAEDAAQEAFAQALNRLPKLRDEQKFAPWLGRICRNVAVDMVRSKARAIPTEPLSDLPTESKKDEDNGPAVRKAIQQLPRIERELILLRYYDNLSHEAICDVLGLTRGAVNGRLSRARKKIGTALQKNGFAR